METNELVYQCLWCLSKNCGRIHQDVFAEVDVIKCFDCGEEGIVYADTDSFETAYVFNVRERRESIAESKGE